ncbi:SCO3374 family protein [Streptomyces sp. NPDC059466]|uniref:SCO3374 family protein n=1 Tax=unclassified Streptomyces TaxID=2593676 RepID=UPI0036CB5C29
MVPTVPLPRRPLDPSDRTRQWYENELGWTTVPGSPVRLATGMRFDVLEVPAEAGFAALRHLGPTSPVALHRNLSERDGDPAGAGDPGDFGAREAFFPALRGDSGDGRHSGDSRDSAARPGDSPSLHGALPVRPGARMRLLVAEGSAEELPGLLDWLEWGAVELDLTAIGAGGSIEAPLPPGVSEGPLSAGGGSGPQGAAVWLRPPEPGCEVEPSLPTLSAMGGGGGAPDLVRLVETMATQCHRIRLRRACAQPLAAS